MKKILSTLLLTCLTLLIGCNGSSGKNDIDTDASLVATSISLTLLDNTGNVKQSFDKAEIITVQAQVLDQNSQALSGQIVEFISGLGTLLPTSKLTNSDGIAIVELSNTLLTVGAASIDANALTLSVSSNFEYLTTDELPAVTAISTTLLLDSIVVNQFKSDQEIEINTLLVDANNQPLANEIITFSADIGTLKTNSALTDASGVARVTLLASSIDNEQIGAGIITATYTDLDTNVEAISNRVNYQILSADEIIVDNEIRIGYFDDSNTFIAGKIELSIDEATISAGGTLGLSVDLVDSSNESILTPVAVTFTSNCVAGENATIDETVFSIKGHAKATFEDIDCAGTTGTDDLIIASISVNEITTTATQTISITGEQLGSIEFISALPTSIVLKGTGGQGKQETSTLTFKVKSELGNVLGQHQVDFSLNTDVGGITLSQANGLTNSQGLVSTRVIAGTVPTAVRVTAKSKMTVNNEEIEVQTQSDLLSVNTGLPEQRSLTLAASVLNPEAGSFNGETSVISAWLADNFNNPVPDGTTVNFTTEGGVIEASCLTVNGRCDVTWTSAEPRVPNHRVTILATALGHETFFDTNGNNTFDESDGNAIVDTLVSSGFGRHDAEPSGFIDMSEAWRDDNENFTYDNGETFIDFNNDQSFSTQDSLFNGPQCQGSNCASESLRAIHVRKSLVILMSSSGANYILSDADNSSIIFNNNIGESNVSVPNIADGAFQAFNFSFSDTATQALPNGTEISVLLENGELSGTKTFTVGNTNSAGMSGFNFFVVNPVDGDPAIATITIEIKTPNNVISSIVKTMQLL